MLFDVRFAFPLEIMSEEINTDLTLSASWWRYCWFWLQAGEKTGKGKKETDTTFKIGGWRQIEKSEFCTCLEFQTTLKMAGLPSKECHYTIIQTHSS